MAVRQVKRRGKVVYQGDWYDKGRRRRVIIPGAKGKKEAEDWLRAHIANEKSKPYLSKADRKRLYDWPDAEDMVTLEQILKSFSKRPGVAPVTLQNDDYHGEILKDYFGKECPVSQIKTGRVEEFAAWRLEQPVKTRPGETCSPVHVNKCLQLLRAALRNARRLGIIDEMPCDVAKLPEPHKDVQTFNADQIQALLQACRTVDAKRLTDKRRTSVPSLYDPVAVMINTGMRTGEVFKIRWADVDVEGGTLRATSFKRGTSKQAAKHRRIPLNEAALEVFKRLYLERESNPDKSALVFGIAKEQRDRRKDHWTKKDGKPRKYVPIPSRFYDRLKEAATIAKVNGDQFRAYLCRHTVITSAFQAGLTAADISAFVGTDGKTLVSKYLHEGQDRNRDFLAGFSHSGAARILDVKKTDQAKTGHESVTGDNDEATETLMGQG